MPKRADKQHERGLLFADNLNLARAPIMQVEPFRLLGGETGSDFVVYDESGRERFSARLMDDSNGLVIAWTDNVPWTVLWLRQVQRLAGSQNRFITITGLATGQLEAAIRAGRFDAHRAWQLLERSLGGAWQLQVRARRENELLEMIAERKSGDSA